MLLTVVPTEQPTEQPTDQPTVQPTDQPTEQPTEKPTEVKDVKATSITLSKSTLALKVGGTETLTATIAPANVTDKTVTWSTSNAKVATVSNGTVKAVANGTATVTAKTANGKMAT